MDSKNSDLHRFSFLEMIGFLARYRWAVIGSMMCGLVASGYVYYQSLKEPSKTEWEFIFHSGEPGKQSISSTLFVDVFHYENFVRTFYLEVARINRVNLTDSRIRKLVIDDANGDTGIVQSDQKKNGRFRVVWRWPSELGSPSDSNVMLEAFNSAIQILSEESSRIFSDYSSTLLVLEKSQGQLLNRLMEKASQPKSELLRLLDSKLFGSFDRRTDRSFMILLEAVAEDDGEKSELAKAYSEIAAKQEILNQVRDRYISKFGLFAAMELATLKADGPPKKLGPVFTGPTAFPIVLFILGGILGLGMGVLAILSYRFVATHRAEIVAPGEV